MSLGFALGYQPSFCPYPWRSHGGPLGEIGGNPNGHTLAVTSSEEAKRLNERAKVLVRQIQNLLSGLYAETPERAAEWGFEVRQSGSRAGKVLIPATRAEVIATLGKYTEKESSRPVAEQFAVPKLSEVKQVYDGLRGSLETRNLGTTERKTAVAGTYEVAEALLEYLQAALAYLLVTKFDRKVTPELGLWGSDVIARPAKASGNGTEPALDGGPIPAMTTPQNILSPGMPAITRDLLQGRRCVTSGGGDFFGIDAGMC